MVLKVIFLLATLALVSLPTCSATFQQEQEQQAEQKCVSKDEFDSVVTQIAAVESELNTWQNTTINILKRFLLENPALLLETVRDKLESIQYKMEQQQVKTNTLLDELATLQNTTMDALTDLKEQQNKTERRMEVLENTITNGQTNLRDKVDTLQDKMTNLRDKVDTLQDNLQDKLDTFQNTTEASSRKYHHDVVELLQNNTSCSLDGQANLQDNLQDKVDTLQDKVVNLQDKLDTFQNTTEANSRKHHHEVVELLQNNISCSLKGILCPQLTNPENGQVVQPLCANFPGSVANYFCDCGYKVFGNVSRECVSMGLEAAWTGEAPTCQRRIYNDCKTALTQCQTTSGIYVIQPDSQPPFQAYCDMDADGGGWTVFQRREDGSVDFFRYWNDYQQGFGNLSGEFWLGLEKIHRLTSTATQLRVDMQDFQLNSRYAKYASFSVGDSASNYTLSVSGYSGTAGDFLSYHDGSRFSTRDHNNDVNDAERNFHCARFHGGAWWFNSCFYSHLNGHYQRNYTGRGYSYGVAWKDFSYYLKFSEMKVRRN